MSLYLTNNQKELLRKMVSFKEEGVPYPFCFGQGIKTRTGTIISGAENFEFDFEDCQALIDAKLLRSSGLSSNNTCSITNLGFQLVKNDFNLVQPSAQQQQEMLIGSIVRDKYNRDAFLRRLFEETEGDTSKGINWRRLGEELGFSFKEIQEIVLYLHNKKLLIATHDVVFITKAGIDEKDAKEAIVSNLGASPDIDNTEVKRELLRQHYRNLDKLRLQAAKYGSVEVPLHLLNQIEDEENEIARLKAELGYDL